jgi:hypothetical protein
MDRPLIPELEKKGWNYRFTANEPRLSETVAFYKETGFEVHLEPLPKRERCDLECKVGKSEDCHICFDGDEERYRMVFTKPASTQALQEEDLF